jgi:hypothetical protein
MDRKKTNLCVSVDVTTTKEVLEIVRAVGDSVCMVKVSEWAGVVRGARCELCQAPVGQLCIYGACAI